jgi:hypothetical protein
MRSSVRRKIHGVNSAFVFLLTPALSSFCEERENYFVGRFPGVGACARPPAHQRRANFRYAFSVFEFALISEIRVKESFNFSSFRPENF